MVRRLSAAIGIVVIIGVIAGALTFGSGDKSRAATTVTASKPNIVFILTDDLSWNLINRRFAPHIVALEKRVRRSTHYFVADSLCCPSRSTIFTGLFPHDTKVVANVGQTAASRSSKPSASTSGRSRWRSSRMATRPRCSASTSTATATRR